MPADTAQQTSKIYTILSLGIAALAVFVSPLITYFVTKLQLRAAREAAAAKAVDERKIANKQIVAPMRQAWIEKLRADIASFLALCNAYSTRGTSDQIDEGYDKILQLLLVIKLSLNSAERDHLLMIGMLEDFRFFVSEERIETSENDFLELHRQEAEIVDLAKEIFKKEWQRVKSEDAN
jgi:hypothetical protein